MSNISLGGNHGNSINFDGTVLQNQQEDEYRKEEEQQQNELRALLTNAFDDLIDDDDILSITSEEGTDSRNVSLVRRHSNDSLGRPPTEERIEEEKTEEEWPQRYTHQKQPTSEGKLQDSVPAQFPHHLARRYGHFEPLSRTQELQRRNTEALRTSVESLPSFPTASQDLTDRVSSVQGSEHVDSDYHSNVGDNRKSGDFHGIVYPQNLHQGQGHGNIHGQNHNTPNFVKSEHVNSEERENLLRRSIEDFSQLREAYLGQGQNEQFYGDLRHHQHFNYQHQHPAEQPYDQSQGQMDVNHGQGHYYQGHDAGGHHQAHLHGYQDHHHHFKNIYENRPYHTIGEREETEGGNVQTVTDGHFYNPNIGHGYGYHDNMCYYRNDYVPQGQEVASTNHTDVTQGHVGDHRGFSNQGTSEGTQLQATSQSQTTSTSRRLPNLQRHVLKELDRKEKNQTIDCDGQIESERGHRGKFPEGHKVTYKRDHSEKNKAKEDKINKKDKDDTKDDRAFLEQGGSMDQQQLAQLQILYKARGKKIEELTNELEVSRGDAARELRILKHQLSVARAEKEGSIKSLDSVQDLLQEVKGENSKLIGKLHAAESQIESLKKGKDEITKKLQTAESTIESLHQHLEDLGSSDSLTRARHEHETVVNGLQKKYETEIRHLQEKISELNNSLHEKGEEIKLLNLKLMETIKASEQAQISRAETINRLTQSLEESQKRCRNLLESTASQDLSQMKIQLQQALASRTIADEMCSSLQDEILDLKEQVQMLESASSLGVSSQQNTNMYADQNDSMADLGIRKTLDFDTPQNTPVIVKSQSKLSSEMVTSLKSELERCLISNKQKRLEVSQLKEELKKMKKDLADYKMKFETADLLSQEQKRRISELESSMIASENTNAVENRLKKDVDNLKREKKILSEDIEELQKRLEEISQSEEKLTELNRELSKQIGDMVKEYDQDKRQAIERVQRACEQVSETSRNQLRQELTIQFDGERSDIISKYEKELNNLRQELKTAQDEIDRVKELYVNLCEEKDQMKEKMDSEWIVKLEQSVQKVKEEMLKENELTMLRVEESWEKKKEIEMEKVKEDLKKEFESKKSKTVEEVTYSKNKELELAKTKFQQEIQTMKDIMEIERSNDMEKIDKEKLNEIEKLRKMLGDKEEVIKNLEKEKYDLLGIKTESENLISQLKQESSQLKDIQLNKEKELSDIKTERLQTVETLKGEIREKSSEIEQLHREIENVKYNLNSSMAEVEKQKSEEISKIRKDFDKLLKEKELELEKLRKEGTEKDEVENLRKEIDKKGRQSELETLKKEVICLKLEIERMDNDKQIEIDKVCRVKQSELENLEKRKHNEIERLKKEKAMELDRLTKEKDEEIAKLREKLGRSSDTDVDVATKFKDRLNKEMEESIQKAVDAKVAMSKVVWLEEHRATRQTAIDNAVRLAEAELKLKMEAELDDKLQKRLEEVKVLWQSDLFQQLEEERSNWETQRDKEIEEIIKQEHEKWRQTELKIEIEEEEEKWLKDFEQRLDEERQKWAREFEQKLEQEKESWIELELETEHLKWTLEWEKRIQDEKESWQKNILDPAKRKWKHDAEERLRSEKDNWRCMELEPEKLNLMREFEERLKSEKQSWISRDLPAALEREKKTLIKEMEEKINREKEVWKSEEIPKEVEREKRRWMSDIEEKMKEEKNNWKNSELPQEIEKERRKWMKLMEVTLAKERDNWKSKELPSEVNKVREELEKSLDEQVENQLTEKLTVEKEKLQKVQCAIETTRGDCHREYTMEMSINTTSAEASQGLLREELESMKQRVESLQSDLIQKEADWLKEKENLINLKDLERRNLVDSVQEKAEVEYKQFLMEHQDTLDKALKQAREQHNKNKVDMETRYTTQIKLLQATVQSLKNQLHDSLSGTQEQSNMLAEIEKERVIWYEERDQLVQEIAERDSLLGKADVHLSKEVDKLRSELQAAYQRRLESEMASYKQKLESDIARVNNSEQKEKLQLEKQLSEINTELKKLKNQNSEDKTRHAEEIKKLSDVVNECQKKVDEFDRMEGELKKAKELLKGYKEEINNFEENTHKYKKESEELQNKLNKAVQNQEKLQVELQKVKEEKLTVIESVKSIENTYKQKHEEAVARIAKTEKVLQDVKLKYKTELDSLRKALEAENDVAMNAMKNKMIELQKKHVTMLDEMRKKHIKEKEVLIKQGQITAGRGVTPTAHTGDVEKDITETVKELRSQYLDTVTKIKGDVLRHITETNVRAAETVKLEMDKERFSTFQQIKEFYKQNVKQILETELIGSTLESKLLAVEEALENLSSTPSSRSATPKSDDFILDEKQRSRSTSRDARDAGISPKSQRTVSFVTATRGDRSRTPISNTTKEIAWVGDKSFEDPRSPKGSRYEESQGEGRRGRVIAKLANHSDRSRDASDLRASYEWNQDTRRVDTRHPDNRPKSAKLYREYRTSEQASDERPLSAKSPRELHITLREKHSDRNYQEMADHRQREQNRVGEKRKQRTLISTRDIHSGRYSRPGGSHQVTDETVSSRSKSVTPMYSGLASQNSSLYRPTSVPDLSAEDKELKIWTETNNDTYRYTPLRDTLRSGTNLHRSNSKSESDLSLAEKTFVPLKQEYDSNLDLSTGSLTSMDSFMSPRKRDAGETPTSTPRRARKHLTLHSFPTREQITSELRNQSSIRNDDVGVNSPTSSAPRERKNLPLIQFRHGKMTSLSRVGATCSKSPHPEESVIHRDTPPTRDTTETPDRHYRPLSVSSNLHLDL